MTTGEELVEELLIKRGEWVAGTDIAEALTDELTEWVSSHELEKYMESLRAHFLKR